MSVLFRLRPRLGCVGALAAVLMLTAPAPADQPAPGNPQAETTAEIFYVGYPLEPASPERPVTFVFNGGPGAASAFLHLGALGPRALVFAETGGYLPPPGRVEDNPDTWLDFTDLVFVDPVGTGYSRTADVG